MKSLSIYLTFIGILLFIICPAQETLISNWQDANHTEIASLVSSDYQYDKNSKIYYHISNNTEKLFIHLKVEDQTTQQKLIRFGLTTWIDISGKNKKKQGVKFPQGTRNNRNESSTRGRSPNASGGGNNALKMSIENMSKDIELINLGAEKGKRTVAVNNDENIITELLLTDSNHLLFALEIPLEQLGKNLTEAETNLSINIETGFMVPPAQQSTNTGRASGRMSRTGSRGGGSARLGQGNQASSPFSTPSRLRIKQIQLVQKN